MIDSGSDAQPAPKNEVSSLAVYLRSLRNHSLFSRDEEHELAVRYVQTHELAPARLIQAVQRCDPFRGVKLSTYAAWPRLFLEADLGDSRGLVPATDVHQ